MDCKSTARTLFLVIGQKHDMQFKLFINDPLLTITSEETCGLPESYAGRERFEQRYFCSTSATRGICKCTQRCKTTVHWKMFLLHSSWRIWRKRILMKTYLWPGEMVKYAPRNMNWRIWSKLWICVLIKMKKNCGMVFARKLENEISTLDRQLILV